MESSQWKDYLSEAIRYWEPRRLIYNLALGVVVIAHFAAGWPSSRLALHLNVLLLLFVLAVLANVAYCAAYVADVFVQASGFRERWLKMRWVVLVIGLAFASTITHFFASSIFSQ